VPVRADEIEFGIKLTGMTAFHRIIGGVKPRVKSRWRAKRISSYGTEKEPCPHYFGKVGQWETRLKEIAFANCLLGGTGIRSRSKTLKGKEEEG